MVVVVMAVVVSAFVCGWSGEMSYQLRPLQHDGGEGGNYDCDLAH